MNEMEKRRQAGRRVRAKLGLGDPVVGKQDAFFDHTLTELWGSVFTRPGLSLREREMITLAVIIAVGGAYPNMEPHFRALAHLGLSDKQIREIIIQTMYYAGWPKGAAALLNYKQLLQNQKLEKGKKNARKKRER